MARLIGPLTGWLLFAGLVAAIGAVGARWTILPRTSLPDAVGDAWVRTRAARIGRAGGLLLVPAMGLVLFRQLQEFRDPFVPWTEDAGLLLGTSWGTHWKWAVGAAVLVAVGFLLAAAGKRVGWWLAAPATLALAAFPALTGHASGGDGPSWLLLPADVLHVLAAGAWMGGLAVVLYLEWRWRRRTGDERAGGGPDSLLPSLVPVFSPVAVASVATLVVTGSAASWIHLESPGALVSTGYGWLLLLKLGVVALVLGLGALNWKRITPLLSTEEGPPKMRRAAGLELALGTLVLLVTAILVRTSPM